MNRMLAKIIALGSFALLVLMGASRQAPAQDAKAPYPSLFDLRPDPLWNTN